MKTETRLISSEVLFKEILEQLALGRQAVFTVMGMSMWPFLCSARDSVALEKCDPQKVKHGDVILYCTPGERYILHRITGLTETSFQATGDGNIEKDPWYSRDCICAKAVAFHRKGRVISCEKRFWKCIFFVWMGLFPVRKHLLSFLRKISTISKRFR